MISMSKRRMVASKNLLRSGPVTAACCVLLLTTVTTSLSSSASTPAVSAEASSYSLANFGRPIQDASSSIGNVNNCPTTIISPGLKNLGNICYLNSQLECAFHIPRVRQLVLKQEDNSATESAGLVSLRQVFTEMLESSSVVSTSESIPSPASAASPRPICQALQIPVWEQQDAQEFWKLLLPALQRPKLMDLYQGAFEDYIRALDGSQRERLREEAFLDLSLDLVTSDSPDTNILDSFEVMFRKPELLRAAEGNGWKPEKGATPIDAEKGARLKEQGLPSILQLHLKRFQYDWQTDTMRKVNLPCTFPLNLDLNPLLATAVEATESSTPTSESALYDLQSVVVHVGEFGVGHYYSYVRPDVTKSDWYRFNDDQVARVDVSQVLQDAYGGVRTIKSLEADNVEEVVDGTTSRSWWQRRLSWLFPQNSARSELSSGYGGPTGNAYVLQYIRRRDIPFLYQLDADGKEE